MPKLPRGPALLTMAVAAGLFAQTAAATDLLEVWRAAAQNDKSYAVDSAAHAAAMPLYNPERRAQQQQLNLSADVAELEWQAAAQTLMLRTAERYLDLAQAEEANSTKPPSALRTASWNRRGADSRHWP